MWKDFGIKCVNWSIFCILDEFTWADGNALTVESSGWGLLPAIIFLGFNVWETCLPLYRPPVLERIIVLWHNLYTWSVGPPILGACAVRPPIIGACAVGPFIPDQWGLCKGNCDPDEVSTILLRYCAYFFWVHHPIARCNAHLIFSRLD